MLPSKVTIAIPTRNRAGYLRLSLASALAQTYENLEIVVSNNACTDDTASVLDSVRDPRLRILYQPTLLSMMENWNTCLSAASGKYFLLLSDDDVLEPTAIEEMVKAYEDSERGGEQVGLVYCSGKMIYQNGDTLRLGREAPATESVEKLIVAFLDGKRDLWPCVILFRKDDIASGYDVRFPLGADAAQWMRVAITYGMARFVKARLANYRWHENTTAKTRLDVWRGENEALGDFVIDELRKSGQGQIGSERAIHGAVHRLNVRITSELINNSLRSDKNRAFSEYWKNHRVFGSRYGLMILTKGVVLLMLPDSFRAWVRRRLYAKSTGFSFYQVLRTRFIV